MLVTSHVRSALCTLQQVFCKGGFLSCGFSVNRDYKFKIYFPRADSLTFKYALTPLCYMVLNVLCCLSLQVWALNFWLPQGFSNYFISLQDKSFGLKALQNYWYFLVLMSFCFENCSNFLSKKHVLVTEKNFYKSRLKSKNLQKNQDHYNHLFKQ